MRTSAAWFRGVLRCWAGRCLFADCGVNPRSSEGCGARLNVRVSPAGQADGDGRGSRGEDIAVQGGLVGQVSRVSERAHGSGVDAALCARRILRHAGVVLVFVWGGTVPTMGMRRPSRRSRWPDVPVHARRYRWLRMPMPAT